MSSTKKEEKKKAWEKDLSGFLNVASIHVQSFSLAFLYKEVRSLQTMKHQMGMRYVDHAENITRLRLCQQN